jgi:GNAT superfamily N-acetyltransferase
MSQHSSVATVNARRISLPEYVFSVENGNDNFHELEPLYRKHYSEMQERLASEGISIGTFDMRLDVYREYWGRGHLINYVARKSGAPTGYGNFYVTSDMHNGELIAQEDALYMLPEHRNGAGRRLAKFVLEDLRKRGVKRLNVSAVTDVRADQLWKRLGFKPTAQQMTYTF